MTTGGTVVIGVGNEFRHDDGLGLAVIDQLRQRDLPDVRLAVTDGDPARLIDLWAGAELAVVVDAARAAPPSPGRIHRLGLSHSSGRAVRADSSHGLGLGDAVELATVLGLLPSQLVVYAVEPADLAPGPGLSPPVRDAVARVVDAIAAEVSRVTTRPAKG